MPENASDTSAGGAAEERLLALLTAYERQRNDRTRRQLVRGLVGAARVAAVKEVDKNLASRERKDG